MCLNVLPLTKAFRAPLALIALFIGLSCLPVAVPAAVVPLTIEDMVAVSDTVITVRVKDTSSAFVHGKIATTANLQVLDTIKGKSATQESVTYMGGSYRSLVMDVPEVAKLRTGEEAVLFLSKPIEHASAKEQKSFNTASPLVSSYQVIGGWQGKINLVSPTGEENKSRKDADPLPGDMAARRTTKMVDANLAKAVPYSQLRNEIAGLVQNQKDKQFRKAAPQALSGIAGKYVRPDKSASPLIRAFDPLPSLAYLSDSELKQVNELVQKSQKIREEQAASQKAAGPESTPK
ncbi:hypothetical protein BH09SUM1_BH09SUM1_06220 [soil metagenome]